MKDRIIAEISRFVGCHQRNERTTIRWETPIVRYADAEDPLFAELKRVASQEHLLPRQLLATAKTVVTFFLPFDRQVATSNIAGELASELWAIAYIETNTLITAVCEHMRGFLESSGYRVATTPATHNFDPQRLVSNWSHRHVGYVAGLGKFGLNNMLITEHGCCGRIGSLVTDLRVDPDQRSKNEACLYRHDSSCLKCVARCVNAALYEDRFDRWKCHQMCRRNEEHLREIGTADVCGKCLVDLPCSFTDPVKSKASSG
jgi:epoxyqueuosine reductase QueG